ncbi:GNAT family N-acetyltransferase [Martelella mediterranea]|uniref:Ribosomal-protein-alanine acetyltransferase n=1 Tax=Martelella mediterranea DSM 17316 TaxID=1122214 RepID=A0A1U9YVD5_9HYPH|nr:GNAT family N-acetyltransferase [Martelella mediterranea]AQZ49398.1 ribosomal-protein-alanine acetyltransferase [Martelella mediterranea DSM 17316]
MTAPVIRDAGPADRDDWLRLWQGYLEFYGTALDDAVTAMTWNRIIDPVSAVFTRLALVDDTVAGFATCILHPRTWAVEPACYLEDLFVDPARRGSGIGRALIDDLIAIGRRDGWTNLYWHTNADNAQARRLYDSYNKADGFVRYRLPLQK